MGRDPVPWQAASRHLSFASRLPARSKVPAIVMVPGMDGNKEKYVSLYGDPWMQRGFAFLAVEGPGYWEAPLRGIYTDVSGWVETGKEVMKWLLARPEIDPDKIVVIGSRL